MPQVMTLAGVCRLQRVLSWPGPISPIAFMPSTSKRNDIIRGLRLQGGERRQKLQYGDFIRHSQFRQSKAWGSKGYVF